MGKNDSVNIENCIYMGKRFLFATFQRRRDRGFFVVRLVASFLYGHTVGVARKIILNG